MPTAGSQSVLHTAPKITSRFVFPYCLNFVLSILIQNTSRNGRQTLTRDSYICVFSFLLLHSGYPNSVESWLNITAARFPTLRLITRVETLSHTGNFLACNSRKSMKRERYYYFVLTVSNDFSLINYLWLAQIEVYRPPINGNIRTERRQGC